MSNLEELISLCEVSLEITINQHKSFCHPIKSWIGEEDLQEIEEDVLNEIIKRDMLVCVQAYNETSTSCWVIYHYDVNKAIEKTIELIKEENIKDAKWKI